MKHSTMPRSGERQLTMQLNWIIATIFFSLVKCVGFILQRIIVTLLAALQAWHVVDYLHISESFASLANLCLGNNAESCALQGCDLGCVLSEGIQSKATWNALGSFSCSVPEFCHLSSFPLILSFCCLQHSEARSLFFSTCQQKCFNSSRPRSVYRERWAGKHLSVDFLFTTPCLKCQLIFFNSSNVYHVNF